MISVIVPIYNSSKNLSRCVDSIINQSYTDTEILLINDGSQDNSLDICREFEIKDKRIKVINKENTGVSDTRNIGVEISKGEYIAFVDSDDYLEIDYLKKMHEASIKNHVDVVRCNINAQDINGNICHEQFSDIENRIINKNEINNIIERFVTLNNNLSSYVFLLLIKKEKIVKFDTSLSFMEDTFFYINLLLNIDTIYFLNENLYTYKYNEQGASKNYKRAIKNIYEIISARNHIKSILKEKDMLSSELDICINNKIFNLIISKFEIYTLAGFRNLYNEIRKFYNNKETRDEILNINKNELGKLKKIEYFLVKKKLYLLLTCIIYLIKILKRG